MAIDTEYNCGGLEIPSIAGVTNESVKEWMEMGQGARVVQTTETQAATIDGKDGYQERRDHSAISTRCKI